LGVIFSLAVGVGLMVLIFYSSRMGYDEPAVLIQSRRFIGMRFRRAPKSPVFDPRSFGRLRSCPLIP
jgi:hypothetical protein